VGKGCPGLRSPNAVISPDNRRVACIVGPFQKRDDGRVVLLEGRQRLVVDGVEGPEYDWVGGPA